MPGEGSAIAVRDTLEDIRISGNILYTRRGDRISRFIASMTSFSSTAASLRQQRQAERALSSGSARDRNRLPSGFYELLSWIGSSGTAVACSAWPSVTPSVRRSSPGSRGRSGRSGGWSAGGRTTSNPASGWTIPHSHSVFPGVSSRSAGLTRSITWNDAPAGIWRGISQARGGVFQ